MKIYYASSIRGFNSQEKSFFDGKIVEYLLHHGFVLGGSIINGTFNPFGETKIKDSEIHDREVNWLRESNILISEVTYPSLGVGYIISKAIQYKKKILCLYRPSERVLSAMVKGNKALKVDEYNTIEEAKSLIGKFLSNFEGKIDITHTITEINKEAFKGLITGRKKHKVL